MSGFLTKIAHNNRVSLGPKDLRNLGDLIKSEKGLIEAEQKLASERIRSSAALKEWGAAEGADLGDTLSCMAQLFDLLSQAETTFADHNSNYRMHYKEVRRLEENLASLKRTQASLESKIDTQERKVSKMKEENKDLPSAQQKLQDLKEDKFGLDNQVMNEDARVGDLKRTITRDAMSLKLGALLELGEKMIIIAEIGKLVVDEIPIYNSEPGVPRPAYHSFDRTHTHMDEVRRCLSEVIFNPAPLGSTPRPDENDDYEYDQSQQHPPQLPGSADPYAQSPGGNTYSPGPNFDNVQTYNRGRQDSYPDSPSGPGYEEDRNGGAGRYHQQQEQQTHLPEIQEMSPSLGGGRAGEEYGTPAFASQDLGVGQVGTHLPPGAGFPSSEVGLGHEDANRSSLAYMDDGLEEEAEEQHRREEEWAEEANAARRDSLGDDGREEDDEERERQEANGAGNDLPLPIVEPLYPDRSMNPQYPTSNPTPQYPTSTSQNTLNQSQPHNEYAPPLQPLPSYSPPSSSPGNASPNQQQQPQPTQRTTRPIVIRGDSALGSKHGDVFVPGSTGAVPPIGSAAAYKNPGAGSSGYNPNDSNSVGSGSGVVTASAFRRRPPPPKTYTLPPVNDGKYPILSAQELAAQQSMNGPTEANRIRDEYLAQSQLAGEGELAAVERPSFDTSPLQVGRKPPPRADTLPVYPAGEEAPTSATGPTIQNDGWRSNGRGGSDAGHGVTQPYSPQTPQGGFQSSQFVTRLD